MVSLMEPKEPPKESVLLFDHVKAIFYFLFALLALDLVAFLMEFSYGKLAPQRNKEEDEQIVEALGDEINVGAPPAWTF
jgi:Na+/H+ antiporter NhaC